MMMHKLQMVVIFLILPLIGIYMYAEQKDIHLSEIFSVGAPVLHIGDIPMRVEIADTKESREKGLSGRAKLDSVNGLLFVFDATDYHGIWMKDMRFPIDIIWISEDLTVIAIEEGVSPETYPKTFRPPLPVRYVVETNVHYADTFGIGVGQKVVLPIDLRKN
jgi:uncharacterized membrane protein (UPF0127 family)